MEGKLHKKKSKRKEGKIMTQLAELTRKISKELPPVKETSSKVGAYTKEFRG